MSDPAIACPWGSLLRYGTVRQVIGDVGLEYRRGQTEPRAIFGIGFGICGLFGGLLLFSGHV